MTRTGVRSALCLALLGATIAGAVPSWFPRGFRTAHSSDPAALRDYLAVERLDIADSIHRFGTVRIGKLEIACQTWSPPHSRGTVFLVHGYYNHTGTWSPHIRRFLSEGWSVASLDLPGHGLSDGPRFDADSMGTYTLALRALEDSLRSSAPKPWSLVGHSLGGLVVLDRARKPDYPYANTVLLAPMVRYTGWTWIGAVLPIVSPFKDYMDRGQNLTSSGDSAFLRRLHTDPLEGWKTSTHWLKEVRRWGAQASSAKFASSHWFLLQGDMDQTVDFHHDIDWISDRTGGLRVRIFKGAHHHLHNEAGALGALVQASLDSAIGGALPLARK